MQYCTYYTTWTPMPLSFEWLSQTGQDSAQYAFFSIVWKELCISLSASKCVTFVHTYRYASWYVRVSIKFNKQLLQYYIHDNAEPFTTMNSSCSRVSNLATICHGISQCTESKALINADKKDMWVSERFWRASLKGPTSFWFSASHIEIIDDARSLLKVTIKRIGQCRLGRVQGLLLFGARVCQPIHTCYFIIRVRITASNKCYRKEA